MTTYDPSKKYQWTPETQFTIPGGEFGLILNSLRAIVTTPEAVKILTAAQAANVIESVLAKAVEEGAVTEAVEETQTT
jgi:hypothetical protein